MPTRPRIANITVDGIRRCGAMTNAGTPCMRRPKEGRDRCRTHGGNALQGTAAPNFKTGRYSKVLPARLIERYNESKSDKELLAMVEEIALIDARLADMLIRVEQGEPGELWEKLGDGWQALDQAMQSGDGIATMSAMRALETAIKRGASDWAAWAEISRLIEQRRKTSESEQKRLVAMQQMITSEQLLVLLGAISDTIRRHIHDRDILASISTDIGRLVSRPAISGTGTGLTA
jgi:hypothetical protein